VLNNAIIVIKATSKAPPPALGNFSLLSAGGVSRDQLRGPSFTAAL